MFVVFWGNPSVQIYIIEETNLKSIIFVTGTENRHTHEITPLSKHKALNPQKLATRNLNDFKVIQFGNYFFLIMNSNIFYEYVYLSMRKSSFGLRKLITFICK